LKTLIIFSLLSFSLLFLSFPETSFADHGSGGGGGCSGDCFPPSLGIGEYQRQVVDDGLIIDGKSFSVEHYEQSIETQFFQVGETVEITLNINENSGAFYLTNVQLMLGEDKELVSGQHIPIHPVQIVWEKTLDGEKSFFVIDEDNLISNVTVESFIDGDPVSQTLTTLNFSFILEKEFDLNPLVVNMWDYNRNSWKNYFYNAIEISSENSGLGEINFSKTQKLNLPPWIKNNAGFWADGLIDDSSFVTGIKYCIDNDIIHIPDMTTYSSENVLHFVDISKGPQHYIDRYYNEPSYREWFDTNFPDYTIEEAVGISSNSTAEIPMWVKTNAGWWAAGQIDDKTFVQGLEYLISNGILQV